MSGARRRSVILGTGSELPAKVITNHDLEKIVETSDEWITVRTGIKQRRGLGEGKSNAGMAGSTPPPAPGACRRGGQNIDPKATRNPTAADAFFLFARVCSTC